jgi:hypothetical protein
LDHERRVNYLVRDALPRQIAKLGITDPTNGEITLKEGTVSWTYNDVTDQLEITTTIQLTQQERTRANNVLANHPEWNAVLL